MPFPNTQNPGTALNKPIPFGKYYLLERINVGGMAEVFRAKHFGVEGFERLVAVKRILPAIAEDKDFVEMFVDEAKIAVQLNHANIAQVFNLGHEDGAYFIALEHIHGRDLRAIFDKNRNHGEPMPVPQACFVIMKMCEGLDYAHNKRDETGQDLALVHRDVSPQNILVSFDGEIKLIDFGIAKAAGKASQTQAGILKGKFGYMSPEQVRGLPVDRRSDVFSCGIVLYELLTGERLFVGESDFSTLEKVRNVEILPPSTYNRKIQPELERIVLKALAKDVEDRYQNAIDLHDELQAFVYTAGEFYSRKDLASWMKQVWAKEIKEETARIASYRDMVPPPQSGISTNFATAPQRTQTRVSQPKAIAPRKTVPPPIPGASRAVTSRPASSRPVTSPPPFRADKVAAKRANAEARKAKGDALVWDDDELETSIYDEEPSHEVLDEVAAANAIAEVPLAALEEEEAAPKVAALSGSALSGDTQVTPTSQEPDLSSLVASQPWEAKQESPQSESPSRVADGSNRTKSPFIGATVESLPEPVFHPEENAFAPSLMAPAPRKSNMVYALIAVGILMLGGIAAMILTPSGSQAVPPPVAQTAPVVAPAVATGPADPKTGFDLIVNPQGVKVSLDGRAIGKAPLQIRGLPAGQHSIEIEAPNGFFSKHEIVHVAAGTAERVVIKLDAMEMSGTFNSEPAGASVSLIADGMPILLGAAPVSHPLDPRKRYEVVFKKDGYVTVTKPVEITGDSVIHITGSLSRARVQPTKVAVAVVTVPPAPTLVAPTPIVAPVKVPVVAPVKVVPKTPVSSGKGTLLLSAKPPCKIFINGRDTGKMTPQRKITLPVGTHRITLVNNEHGIKDSFSVKIKANSATKSIKNFTDQIK